MQVAFRADASIDIGAGHVMRCLTLARRLRNHGADCQFICRELPGHLCDHILEQGFKVHHLPVHEAPIVDEADAPTHFRWAHVPTKLDAAQTRDAIGPHTDWLVLDHYAFDRNWQDQALTGSRTRLFVIDDLADRPHRADALLDQNLGRCDDDYRELVPDKARLFTGPDYALLRPEFAKARPSALSDRKARQGRLETLLVTMGGFDAFNATGTVLNSLINYSQLHSLHVRVILGGKAPHLAAVNQLALDLPFRCEVLTDVTDMAEQMAWADLSIGAVGSTTWERCTLGLPTLMVVIADNQAPAARAMNKAGAGINLGWPNDRARFEQMLNKALESLADKAALMKLSKKAANICDGTGTDNICKYLLTH